MNILSISEVVGNISNQKFNKLQNSGIDILNNFNSQNFGLGFKPLSDSVESDTIGEYSVDPPSQFDWRNYNGQDWTTIAKNQGSCGSCWDFAAHSCLEAVINIVEGDSSLDLDLSEQYILSCYSGGWGCGGSNAYYAYQYLYLNGGAIPETCFPYTANDGTPCSNKCSDWQDKLVPITGYGYSGNPPINDIKNKIVTDGPVCLSFEVYSDFYVGSPSFDSNGVYRHLSGSYQGGHQIAAVGYVDTPDNPNYDGYWICKNSWGATWGPWNNGFFGIAYGQVDIDGDVVWVEYTKIDPGTLIIDQQQDQAGYQYQIYNNRWLAQSFKPSYDRLSKVDLLLGKSGVPPSDITVSILSSLTGSELASVTLPSGSITASADWVEFDFLDITVIPDNTYYIVLHTNGGSISNCYLWSYGFNTPYPDGIFHFSLNSGSYWFQFSSYDFCFRTYTSVEGPPTPELSYAPISYDFGDIYEDESDSTSFAVWNAGTGVLTYTLSESCSWVTLSSDSGDSIGEHDIINVNIDTTDLDVGFHSCDISIISNGGNGIFTIYINVILPIPILSYNPDSYDFGDKLEGMTDSTNFQIWNSGAGILSYSLSESCDWVTLSSNSGDSNGEHDSITVSIDTSGLSPGSHSCLIDISSNAGSGTFNVYVNVILSNDILDQQQTLYNRYFACYSMYVGGQSFKPTLSMLTRVEIYMRKSGVPSNDVVLSIRSNPYGSDLVSISKPGSQIPINYDWIEFDFNDLIVTPGNTYYIILKTTASSIINCYYWGYDLYTPYIDGVMWQSNNGGSHWMPYTLYDFSFKTYGYNNNEKIDNNYNKFFENHNTFNIFYNNLNFFYLYEKIMNDLE